MRRLAETVVRWPAMVILFWVAIAVLLPQSVPSLNDMAQKNPLAMLPGNAPSSVAAREMTKGFAETGTDDLLLVVLSDDRGLGAELGEVGPQLVAHLVRHRALGFPAGAGQAAGEREGERSRREHDHEPHGDHPAAPTDREPGESTEQRRSTGWRSVARAPDECVGDVLRDGHGRP